MEVIINQLLPRNIMNAKLIFHEMLLLHMYTENLDNVTSVVDRIIWFHMLLKFKFKQAHMSVASES